MQATGVHQDLQSLTHEQLCNLVTRQRAIIRQKDMEIANLGNTILQNNQAHTTQLEQQQQQFDHTITRMNTAQNTQVNNLHTTQENAKWSRITSIGAAIAGAAALVLSVTSVIIQAIGKKSND
jgi:D-ribose pyranose/furanose isomerase RbsD